MRTDRYGQLVLSERDERELASRRRSVDPEALIRERMLNGPLAELVRETIRLVPDVSPYQLDRSIESYMKRVYMAQGGQVR